MICVTGKVAVGRGPDVLVTSWGAGGGGGSQAQTTQCLCLSK